MFSKLKQFKDIREQGKKLQDTLSKETITVRTMGDKIVMIMDGNLQMTGLTIDDELLALDKKEKLQNGIKEAHAEALKKMQRIMAGKMQELGGLEGLGLK